MTEDNPIPAYAPTSTNSFVPSASGPHKYYKGIDRSQIVKSPQERSVYDALSELLSILLALEMIENAYLKDFVTDRDKYTPTALRLISQYLVIMKDFLDDETKQKILFKIFDDVFPIEDKLAERISNKFNLHTSQAVKRLSIGIPQTMEKLGSHLESTATKETNSNSNAKIGARLVAEVTGNFITCMDALKLNYKTKDKLHPLLSDLVVSLNDLVTDTDNEEGKSLEFQGKSRLVNWLIKLNGLGEEELSQQDVNTFLNDLDQAYKNFYTSLN